MQEVEGDKVVEVAKASGKGYRPLIKHAARVNSIYEVFLKKINSAPISAAASDHYCPGRGMPVYPACYIGATF